MTEGKRLIETAFPLAEASAASLHEKNMRHGHISTIHLWPARRPLAASRAAIAAALLADPNSDEERLRTVQKLGGTLVTKKKAKSQSGRDLEVDKLQAVGGVLWWGSEDNRNIDWLLKKIRHDNGDRAPKIIDPFSGGGAIPLEAMRLGCDVVANDLSPVAWLLLKCTLVYPKQLSEQTRPLPRFVCRDADFAKNFLKGQNWTGARLTDGIARMTNVDNSPTSLLEERPEDRPWDHASLGAHIRAWGTWVLTQARRELHAKYPTYAEWCPLSGNAGFGTKEPQLAPTDVDGTANADALNREYGPAYLADPRNPRWLIKPTVAYLWARTVRCKACRATVPLLKTRWLCKKDRKRVVLSMVPNASRTGVDFTVQSDVAVSTGSPAQRRDADKRLGAGTMSRTGVQCPCCAGIMKSENIRFEAKAGRLGQVMTAVVVDGPAGKEYRRPQPNEEALGDAPRSEVDETFVGIPFGVPTETIPLGGSRRGGGSPFTTPQYGLTRWCDLFTNRQLVALGSFVKLTRSLPLELRKLGYDEKWVEALTAYSALANDRIADRGSTIAHWDVGYEKIANTFSGFRLPMSWDFAEASPTGGSTGSYGGQVEWIAKVADHAAQAGLNGAVCVTQNSAMNITGEYDAIITDPPYYDAIPYSDLMDFFYVWLRRSLHGLSEEIDAAFAPPIGPKWDHERRDGELIDDASRFGGDKEASKKNFEDGMAAVFRRCHGCLRSGGILVVVFANKNADAWETLVGAVIRAGFVVDGSLPIQTEMGNRTRAQSSAALSSSVWLVCRKREASAQRGWATSVVRQMRNNIAVQMRRFWDAGIRGPDFVWAATGPALEAYSRHPVVLREASTSGRAEPMPVSEFLREVRRLVVEFAVGRVLRPADGDGEAGALDDITMYYVLHRDTFGLGETPVGAAILYATSCSVSDTQLVDQYELLGRTGVGRSTVAISGDEEEARDDDETDADAGAVGGSKVRLLRWEERRRKNLGVEGVGGKAPPMIDCLHRILRLWKEGDQGKVDAYIEQSSAVRDRAFAQLVQAIIELARRDGKSDEASLLESISNHLRSRSGISAPRQANLL